MAIKSKFFEIDKEDDFFDDDSNEFKICKKCKSKNIATAKFCLECGSNEFVKTSRNKEESFKFCADCKTKVESTAKFCHNCGSKNFVDSLEKILSNVKILEAKYTKEYENLNSKIIDAKNKIKDLNKDIKVLKEKNSLLVSEWEEKLKRHDKYGMSKSQVTEQARNYGAKFQEYDEEEFYVTYLMMISDYKELFNDPMVFIKMAKAFLEDKDAEAKGGEKLCTYMYEIALGGK